MVGHVASVDMLLADLAMIPAFTADRKRPAMQSPKQKHGIKQRLHTRHRGDGRDDHAGGKSGRAIHLTKSIAGSTQPKPIPT